MKVLEGFLVFMGVLAVLAIIALIAGYVLALLTPDMRTNMRPVVLSSEAVDSLTKKLDAVKKEAAQAESTRTPKNVELTITEEEVNSTLVMMLAEGFIPAKEILVNFNDGYMVTYIAWNFPWFPMKTGLLSQVEVENGKPRIMVMDFFLGKLPVPNNVDSSVQELANIIAKLNAPLDELKLNLKQVSISDGKLIMTGTTKIPK
jgi:hypothetical protein